MPRQTCDCFNYTYLSLVRVGDKGKGPNIIQLAGADAAVMHLTLQ